MSRVADPKIQKKKKKHDWSRKLSFADLTFNDFVQNRREVFKKMGDRRPDLPIEVVCAFQEAVFYNRPNELFRPLECRTLSFWVECFNRWQRLKAPGDRAPVPVSGQQMKGILNVSRTDVVKISRLFDRKTDHQGLPSDVYLQKARVSPVVIMFSGVLTSPLITNDHKYSFLFGLFDHGDTSSMDEDGFFYFINAMKSGLGMVFSADVIPNLTRPDVDVFFDWVSKRAAKILKAMMLQDAQKKTEIIKAIQVKQQSQTPLSEGAVKKRSVSFEALKELLSSTEPELLHWRLTMARFCPERLGSRNQAFADEFDDKLCVFRLSHAVEVSIPKPIDVAMKEIFISKVEVVVLRDVLEAHERGLAHETAMETILSCPRASLLSEASKKYLASSFGDVAEKFPDILCRHNSLVEVLRKMHPDAQPKHLRMFKKWCEDYDDLMQKDLEFQSAKQALETFHEGAAKPLIPADHLKVISGFYDQLDVFHNDAVAIQSIADFLESSVDVAAAQFDTDSDGYISRQEFYLGMCPPEYRLPDVSDAARRLLGAIVEYACKTTENEINDAREMCLGEGAKIHNIGLSGKEVPQAVWSEWQCVFDSLDQNGDGKIEMSELLRTKIVSSEVAEYVLGFLDPDLPMSFSREAFNDVMLKAHDYWKRWE